MLERILVPVDGSNRAEAVFGRLRHLLAAPGTEVLVLRAAYVPTALRGADHTSLLEERVAEAKACVDRLTDRLRQWGMRARGIVCRQYPAGAILDAAETERVSLIAMSSHGCTGANPLQFGSVAQKVLQASRIPVLVLPSFETGDTGESRPSGNIPFRPERILVPTDGSRLSLAVVPMAGELARTFGADILTLYVETGVLKPIEAGHPEQGADRFRRAGIEAAHEPAADPAVAAVDYFGQLRVSADPVHAVGDPADRILEVSRSEGADLIAMATHGSDGGIPWSFGSVTQKVLCAARVPMLVVRPPMEHVP